MNLIHCLKCIMWLGKLAHCAASYGAGDCGERDGRRMGGGGNILAGEAVCFVLGLSLRK